MSIIKVPTSFNIDLEFEVPEFYRRFLALLIDMLIQYFYLRIAYAIYDTLDHLGYSASAEVRRSAIKLLILLPIFTYHLLLEITMNGQSFGKKIMGLRVVNENGGRPSISQFLIRWFLRVSDVWIVMLIFLIPFIAIYSGNYEMLFIILAGFGFLVTDIALVVSTKKGQRLGDILAKTILIRSQTKASIEDTVFMVVSDNYIPVFPQIMQLSDRDINAIKSILETARKKGDFNMAYSASEKIKSHLSISSSLAPYDFLDVVMKDYNYLSTK
ncbi:MAG TPA: RDD family protein [Chitinophagaceae bacterium]|nr:RDD family protein [Chitinophagaceae bacterium]